MSETLARAWSDYWTAYRSGDVEAMRKAYDRIEPLQRVASARRTTVKMLACLLG